MLYLITTKWPSVLDWSTKKIRARVENIWIGAALDIVLIYTVQREKVNLEKSSKSIVLPNNHVTSPQAAVGYIYNCVKLRSYPVLLLRV